MAENNGDSRHALSCILLGAPPASNPHFHIPLQILPHRERRGDAGRLVISSSTFPSYSSLTSFRPRAARKFAQAFEARQGSPLVLNGDESGTLRILNQEEASHLNPIPKSPAKERGNLPRLYRSYRFSPCHTRQVRATQLFGRPRQKKTLLRSGEGKVFGFKHLRARSLTH